MNFYVLDLAIKFTYEYLNDELTADELIHLLNKLRTYFVDDEED